MQPPSGELSKEAFLSYSHKDRGFAENLVTQLSGRDLTVWIDEAGLYPGERFWPAIDAAIDRATVLIFIASESSIASAECRYEIDRALTSGKRILPLIIDSVDCNALPESIRERHWIDVHRGAGAEIWLDTLVASVRQDGALHRLSADLLAGARKWADNGKGSYFLEGEELVDALGFIERAAAAQIELAPLQIEYLEESRRRASARAQDLARTHAISRARQLAVQAESMIAEADANLPLAALLATESHRLHPSADARRCIERALLLCRPVMHFEGSPSATAVSGNGGVVVFADRQGLRVLEFPGGASHLIPPPQEMPIEKLRLNREGSLMATSIVSSRTPIEYKTITVSRLSDSRELARARYPGFLRCLVFSEDSRYVAVGGRHARVLVIDVEKGRLHWLPYRGDCIHRLVFSSNGQYLAGSTSNRLYIWRGPAWKRVGAVRSFDALKRLAFSGNTKFVAGCGRDELCIWLRDWFGLLYRRVAQMGVRNVTAIEFLPHVWWVFLTAAKDGSARTWSIAHLSQAGYILSEDYRVEHGAPINCLALGLPHISDVSPYPVRHFATGGDDGIVREWTTNKETGRAVHPRAVKWVRYVGGGSHFVSSAESGSVYLWESNGESPVAPPSDLASLVSAIGRRVGRNLTLEEWNDYFPDEPYGKTFPD